MRIACLSDIHCEYQRYEEIPEADLYLFAGDLTNYGNLYPSHDLYKGFRFLRSISERGKPCLLIPGNHDIGVTRSMIESETGFRWIDGETVKVLGLTFHGESQTTCFALPYLKKEWDHMTDDPQRDRAAFDFERVDVVLSHGPPFALLDNGGYDLEKKEFVHLGSPGLLRYVDRHKPQLVVCGHVHESRGRLRYNNTVIINCAQEWALYRVPGENS